MAENDPNPAFEQDTRGTIIRSGLRASRWLTISSTLLLVLALLASFPLMTIGACLSWVMIGIATGAATIATIRAWRQVPGTVGYPSRATAMKTLLLCLGFLLGSTVLNVLAGNAIADASRSSSSAAQLRGIGRALDACAEIHGTCPSSPVVLVQEAGVPLAAMISPSDRAFRGTTESDWITHSSYLYRPGQGKTVSESNVIIAYEREAFAICEPRVFARKGRLVLFADGRVEHLKAAEFDEALREDEQRRHELGWSTTNVPATSPPGN